MPRRRSPQRHCPPAGILPTRPPTKRDAAKISLTLHHRIPACHPGRRPSRNSRTRLGRSLHPPLRGGPLMPTTTTTPTTLSSRARALRGRGTCFFSEAPRPPRLHVSSFVQERHNP